MNARPLIYVLLIVLFVSVLDKNCYSNSFILYFTDNYNHNKLSKKVIANSEDPCSITTGHLSSGADTLLKYLHPRFSEIILISPSPTLNIITTNNNDSAGSKNDLDYFKDKANNYFITRNLYPLLMNSSVIPKTQMGVNSSLYFEPFSGKKIASIRFKQLDIFGPTFQDTTMISTGWPAKVGNTLHATTSENKLRRQLLFSIGQKVRPLVMADNEKIIRELPYIRDVAIILTPNKYSKDEVDVLIIIKERLEYGFMADINPPVSVFEVVDANMFGRGHQLSAKLIHHQTKLPNWGSEVSYSFSDIGGTFVNGGIGIMNSYSKSGWNLFLEKKFISSEFKDAGGLSFERTYRDKYVTPYNITELDTEVSYLYTDGWYGHTFKTHSINSSLGTAILSGRYFHQHYYSHYGISSDGLIRNHDFILSTLGFSKRNLFKNSRIYSYGITEDIPYGRYVEFASGIDFTTYGNYPYGHFLYSKAYILKGGSYFNWLIGIGGFVRNSSVGQGAINLNFNYFTNFIYFHGNSYRCFINIDFLSGINRYKQEYLSINRNYGLRDFKSLEVKGTNRLKLNMETVRFLNWNYHGFRFAQYFYTDCAFLSNDLKKLFREDFYAGIGVGLRIHNESLVFKVFELRFTWFPIIPPGQNIFYFNAFIQPKNRFDDFL